MERLVQVDLGVQGDARTAATERNVQASSVSPGPSRCVARRARGFTLVELLVVMAIILILVVSVVTVGGWAVRKGQSKNTETVLKVVDDAIELFAQSAPLSGVKQPKDGSSSGAVVRYRDRYGSYPPDELEVFDGWGLPGSAPNPPNGRSLLPGGAKLVPAGFPSSQFPDMLFFTKGVTAQPQYEHRDLAALLIALEFYDEEAASALDRVPERYRVSVGLDPAGQPWQYIDRDDDGTFNEGDGEIRYIVDAWGNPISYFSERDFSPAGTAAVSSNHSTGWSWNRVSTSLVHMNGGRPVLMSYGPNGKEQLSAQDQESDSPSNIGADLAGTDGSEPLRVDNPLNDDNVYSDPGLAEILSRGK